MKSKNTKSIGILLRLRQQDEDGAAQAFAQAKAQADVVRSRIAALEGYLAVHNRQARESLVGAGENSNAQMGRYRRAVADIRAAINDERAKLADAEDALRRRRAELMTAMKHRKAMGQLWDKLIAGRRRQSELLEVKEADERYAATESAKA